MANNFTQKNISAISIGGVKYNLKSVPFHATEAEWLSINYIPKQAEIIVYDVDNNYNYPRFKVGDGETQVSQLPFSIASLSEIQAYVNNQVNSAGHLKRLVLGADQELPSIADAQTDVIYMKPYGMGIGLNMYEEYMFINGAWEVIGNTNIDLSNYATIDYIESQAFLKGIQAGKGLKISSEVPTNPVIDFDTTVVFIFDCGTSVINID